ncbi:DUF1837 domain-containing protein [Lacrimispora sp. AGF001]|uniref:HamA C-terminal domain-containing protein n=1 Tax=Lacrimispora sp. AGF001 TaxID=3401631 RepID=UPI003B43231E
MNISMNGTDFLSSFDLLMETSLDEYKKDRLCLYALKINANEFNYCNLESSLIDPVIDYALSREIKKKYQGKSGTLSKKARKKFKESNKNDGELGELLLYCFLESHLNAPKILSKLELKTSTSLYVNGADGVHFLELNDGNYQLIFGESKMYQKIGGAFDNALKSIYEFKNEINGKGDSKSGIKYEKSLISDNLTKESFNDDEKKFLWSLIYPSENSSFYVDDAFGIFVGFEIEVLEKEKGMKNSDFRIMIHERIKDAVNSCLVEIKEKIISYELQGHDFYIYVVPFTEIDKNRKEILEEVIS